MAEWNSEQYLLFERQRTQPALDLAMHINYCNPKNIVDIGCGPGNSTKVLRQVFPKADLLGIDQSASMIEKAKKQYPDITFRICDAVELSGTYDLLFSNACLQWLPKHDELIPALMNRLNPNGALAVQMPFNEEEPLYQIIKNIVQDPVWNFENNILETNKTLTPSEYFEILSDCSSSFKIWETKYYHVLSNHQELIEWVKGTKIKPYLEYLDKERQNEFEREILERAKIAYPLQKNNQIIFGFQRLFFVAIK